MAMTSEQKRFIVDTIAEIDKLRRDAYDGKPRKPSDVEKDTDFLSRFLDFTYTETVINGNSIS